LPVTKGIPSSGKRKNELTISISRTAHGWRTPHPFTNRGTLSAASNADGPKMYCARKTNLPAASFDKKPEEIE
jgi:hypothetical protein